MNVESIVISVIKPDETEATTSKFAYDEMYTSGGKGSFLETVMDSLHELDKGAIITIRPIINRDDEFETAWHLMSHTAQRDLCDLITIGHKISAMKVVRQEMGWGLKEAKRMVDSEWIWTKIK